MNKLCCLIIMFITCGVCEGQNPLVKQWDKRFGGTSDDGFYSFQQTADGGFILGGTSWSDISGDKTQSNWDSTNLTPDYWIIKTDSLGNKLWNKRFGGTSADWFTCLVQTSDRGYILGGFSVSGFGGDKTQPNWDTSNTTTDYWIVKTDSLGNKQWDKDFGGNGIEYLNSLQQTADGGYILGGDSESDSSGDKTQPSWGYADYWIIKIDSLGNKLWDKRFGGTNYERLFSIKQTKDDGYILGGSSSSSISGDKTEPNWDTICFPVCSSDFWIVKTDSVGNKLWDKRIGGTDDDGVFSLLQTSDGGYIFGGNSNSGISGDKTQPSWGLFADYWIVRTDSMGNKLWDKDFGGIDPEELFNVSLTNDGGYLLSGDSYSQISGNKTENNLGYEQSWLVKTDSSGNLQWDKTIFTTGHDEIGLAFQTKDRCYAIANYTNGGIGGYKTQPNWDTVPPITHDYWIVKFCDTTLTTNLTSSFPSGEGVVIIPNPVTSRLTVITNNNNEQSEVIIYDMSSRKLLSKTFFSSVSLNTEQLAKGVYLYEVRNKNGVIKKGKVVKD